MADLFGFGGVASVLGNTLETKTVGAVNGLIGRGLQKASGEINNLLGPVFGSGFNGGNPDSWLSKANARPDPHLSFDWSIVLPFNSSINNYVEEITAPAWQWSGPEAVFRGGQQMYYPERMEVGTLEIVLYEDNKFTASSYIDAWMQRIGNPNTGLLNYPAEYKKNITIIAQDAAQNPIATLVYFNCWPISRGQVSLQSSSSERTRITVSLSTDGMLMNVGSTPSGVANFGFSRISDFISGVPQSLASSVATAAGIGLNNAIGNLI